MFWPKTLTSQWYRDSVNELAPQSIRGMGEWYSKNIELECDRNAYLEVIRKAQLECMHSYDLHNAIERLTVLKKNLWSEPKPSRFSKAHWVGDVKLHKLIAIDQCIELVDGIRNRYLFN